MNLYPNSHPSDLTAYTGLILMVTRENSLYGPYPDGYLSGILLKNVDSSKMTTQSQLT